MAVVTVLAEYAIEDIILAEVILAEADEEEEDVVSR